MIDMEFVQETGRLMFLSEQLAADIRGLNMISSRYPTISVTVQAPVEQINHRVGTIRSMLDAVTAQLIKVNGMVGRVK